MEKFFYTAQVLGCFSGFGTALLILGIIAVLLCFGGFLVSISEDDEDIKKVAKEGFKASFIVLAIGLVMHTFIPSRQTYIFMMGGKVVDSAIEKSNGEISELPENTLILLNEYIKQETAVIKAKSKVEKNED